MDAEPSTSRRRDVLVGLGCLVGAASVLALFHDLRHDDAFITFRYARNLVEGHGFTFNPGERILGTTTPLFTLLSAGLYALFGSSGLPTAAVAVNCLALGAQAFLLYLLLRRALPWTALVVTVLALLGLFGSHTQLALETQTFAALVLLTVWALVQRRTVLCGLALGLAFLTRYDGGLLVLLVPLWWLGKTGQTAGEGVAAPPSRLWSAAKPLLVAAVPVLPWLVFATLYFGSPLPQTLGAKTGLTPFWTYLGYYAERFLQLPGADPGPVGLALAAVLLSLGLFHVVRRLQSLVPLVLFGAGQLLVYAVIGPNPVQTWHMYVPFLVARLLIVVGALGTVERLGEMGLATRWTASRRRALVTVLGATWIAALGLQTWKTDRSVETNIWLGERHRRYSAVASWLEANVSGHRSFLSIEVGTLGYLTGHRMIDPYGLVTATNDYPRTLAQEDLFSLIRENRPDLVLLDHPWQAVALEQISPYATVKVFPWLSPWSTLLVRDAAVLDDPGQLPALRQRLPRLPVPGGTGSPPPPAR